MSGSVENGNGVRVARAGVGDALPPSTSTPMNQPEPSPHAKTQHAASKTTAPIITKRIAGERVPFKPADWRASNPYALVCWYAYGDGCSLTAIERGCGAGAD